MVFHARITFKEVEKTQSKSIIAIGDTVLVQEDGSIKLLTGGVPRKYQQISYTLDEEDEEGKLDDDEAQKENRNENNLATINGDAILKTRTRGSNKVNENKQLDESLKKGQNGLLDQKLEELTKRFENGEI